MQRPAEPERERRSDVTTDANSGYRQRAAATKRWRTHRALVEAGQKLFAERGWHGTRMADVAKEAGVSVATLHNHFKSKNDLMRVCSGIHGDLFIEGAVVHYCERGRTPIEIIKWALSGLVKHSVRNRNLASAMLYSLLEKPPAELRGIQDIWDTEGPDSAKYGVAAIMAVVADMIYAGKMAEPFEIKCDLPEWEVASYYVTSTLMLACMHPSLSEEEAEKIAVTQLVTVLTGAPPDPLFDEDLRAEWYPPSRPATQEQREALESLFIDAFEEEPPHD